MTFLSFSLCLLLFALTFFTSRSLAIDHEEHDDEEEESIAEQLLGEDSEENLIISPGIDACLALFFVV